MALIDECPGCSEIISVETPACFKTVENEWREKLGGGHSIKLEINGNSFHILVNSLYGLIDISMNL